MASLFSKKNDRLVRIFFHCSLIGIVALTSAYAGWRYHIHRVAIYAESAQEHEALRRAEQAKIMEFSNFFRRPLMSEPPKEDVRKRLRESLEKDWQNDMSWMKERFPDMDERERFIAYLLARVNGSLPVYHPTTHGSQTLEEWLWMPRGNCSHHSLRLALVLDAFDIPSKIMSINTPSFPGHVLVDAWDPVTKKAYWLDANFLTYASLDSKEKAGFYWKFMSLTPDERAKTAETIDFKILPWHFEWVDPDSMVFRPRPLTAALINQQQPSLVGKWKRFFGHELETNRVFWKKAGLAHAPHDFKDFSRLGLGEIDKFAPQTRLDADYEKFWQDQR